MLPISAFAAMGFEHCVANMYFLPVALMIRTYANPKMWDVLALNNPTTTTLAQYVSSNVSGTMQTVLSNVTRTSYTYCSWPDVTVQKAIYANIIPATLGNIAGAVTFVAGAYWFIYLRDSDPQNRLHVKVYTTVLSTTPLRSIKKKLHKKRRGDPSAYFSPTLQPVHSLSNSGFNVSNSRQRATHLMTPPCSPAIIGHPMVSDVSSLPAGN
jgi:hypothetical protein